jgi:hypothetical protein
VHKLSAKPASKDVAERMLQMITGYWITQIVPDVAKYSISDELARGLRLNASMMLRLTGGRVHSVLPYRWTRLAVGFASEFLLSGSNPTSGEPCLRESYHRQPEPHPCVSTFHVSVADPRICEASFHAL